MIVVFWGEERLCRIASAASSQRHTAPDPFRLYHIVDYITFFLSCQHFYTYFFKICKKFYFFGFRLPRRFAPRHDRGGFLGFCGKVGRDWNERDTGDCHCEAR